MRRLISFASLLLFTAIATRPLWSSEQFFYSDDALLHLFRVFAFDQTLRQGVAYPRWVSDLAFGMGYPIFNFYPPLAAYLVETIHLLGITFADAIKFAFIGIIALAGFGAYELAAELSGDEKNGWLVGIVAAATYLFFPYTLTNIYVRGALAESLAAALLPWLLWSLRRTLTRQTVSSIILVALFLALVLVAHSLTLLMSVPVIGAYVLLELARLPAINRLKACAFVAGGGLLGAGLGAIYWLPFIAELPLVKMGVTDEIRNLFSQPYHFFTPNTLFQSSWFYQYGGHELGLVSAILGTLSILLILLFKSKWKANAILIFFSVVAILGMGAMLLVTQPLWLAVPFATMVQYPWRVSVLIGLSLALVVSPLPFALSAWTRKFAPVVQIGVATVIIAAMMWTTMANLAPQQISVPNEITPGQLARFEEITSYVGTTTFGEYLPNTVKVDNLTDHTPQPSTTASDATIQLERDDATTRTFIVSTHDPVSLTLRSLYFPDWRATIDDRPATVYPTTNIGLVTLDVPPGTHRVTFTQGDTTPRQIGTWLSIISTVIIIAILVYGIRRREPESWASVIVLGLALFVFGSPNALALVSQPAPLKSTQISVSPELELIGVRIENAQIKSDAWQIDAMSTLLHIRAYWHVKQSLQDKPFTWQLVDAQGRVASQRTQSANYGTGTMTTWMPNEIAQDNCDLPIDASILPGTYMLRVIYGDSKNSVSVGTVVFNRVNIPPQAETKIAHPIRARFGDNLLLVGYDAPRVLEPGSRLPLTLYWQAERDMLNDSMAVIQLIDVNDKPVVQPYYAGKQFIGLNPSSLWTPGKIIIDRQDLFVPHTPEPGLYRIAVSKWRYPDGEPLLVTMLADGSFEDAAILGEIKVPMNATHAKPQQSLNIAVGSKIRLFGFDSAIQDKSGKTISQSDSPLPRLQAQAGQSLALKLYWQTSADIRTDYKIFVHLVDQNGNVVAQQDQAPDEWKYPTRIWDAGETVSDPHLLPLKNLPPGSYRVRIGMYDAANGERLPMIDSGGRELPERQIEIQEFEIRP